MEEERNRANAPLCAPFIAAMKECFDLKVIYSSELQRGRPAEGPFATTNYFGRGLTFKEYMKEQKKK